VPIIEMMVCQQSDATFVHSVFESFESPDERTTCVFGALEIDRESFFFLGTRGD
jgi:hypothetical protein